MAQNKNAVELQISESSDQAADYGELAQFGWRIYGYNTGVGLIEDGFGHTSVADAIGEACKLIEAEGYTLTDIYMTQVPAKNWPDDGISVTVWHSDEHPEWEWGYTTFTNQMRSQGPVRKGFGSAVESLEDAAVVCGIDRKRIQQLRIYETYGLTGLI